MSELVDSKATWVGLDFACSAKNQQAAEIDRGKGSGIHVSVHDSVGNHINLFFSLTDFAKLMVQGRYSMKRAYGEASPREQEAVQHLATHEDIMEAVVPIRRPGMKTATLLGIE